MKQCDECGTITNDFAPRCDACGSLFETSIPIRVRKWDVTQIIVYCLAALLLFAAFLGLRGLR